MIKSDLAYELAKRMGWKRRSEAIRAIDTMVDIISEECIAGGHVRLIGFGVFDSKISPARTARNPATGETVEVAAKRVPRFVAGKSFRHAMVQADAD